MMVETENSQGYYLLADLEKPFNAGSFFSNDNPVELEIGAGRGDFLVGYAADNPKRNFLAVERKINYLKRGVSKARARDLDNVAFINVDIRYLLMEYVEAQSLHAVHIYFPDPWPKKRHLRRRIVQKEFIELLSEKMVPGGYLHFRTDHAHYFDQMMEIMGELSGFKVIDPDADLLKHQTGFELRFRSRGLPIYIASYRWLGLSD